MRYRGRHHRRAPGGLIKQRGGETKQRGGETKQRGGETKQRGGETKQRGGETAPYRRHQQHRHRGRAHDDGTREREAHDAPPASAASCRRK